MIIRRLPDGEPRRDQVARELCMSERTLQRRLEEERLRRLAGESPPHSSSTSIKTRFPSKTVRSVTFPPGRLNVRCSTCNSPGSDYLWLRSEERGGAGRGGPQLRRS